VTNGDPVVDHELFPAVLEHNTQDITPPFVLSESATMSIDNNLIRKND